MNWRHGWGAWRRHARGDALEGRVQWGAWLLLIQTSTPSDGSGWSGLLFGSGGLLAGLVIAVRAYDSGRVVTRSQHESALQSLREAHAKHVADLKARAQEDREQRDRWERIAWDALKANNRRSRGGADDDEGMARLG